MKYEERLALLKQIESVAALAGVKGIISEDGQMFVISFDKGEGHSQRVFLRPSGATPDGKTVVTIMSPAKAQSKGWFNDFTREEAIELLRLNESMMFARFGIQDPGKESKEMLIVASSNVILESLDAEELRAHLFFVTAAADNYEKKLKVDKFCSWARAVTVDAVELRRSLADAAVARSLSLDRRRAWARTPADTAPERRNIKRRPYRKLIRSRARPFGRVSQSTTQTPLYSRPSVFQRMGATSVGEPKFARSYGFRPFVAIFPEGSK